MSTTSAQPIPAPINTTRSRADSNASAGMGSPTSINSGFSPSSAVFAEISPIYEEPSPITSPPEKKVGASKFTRTQRQSSGGSLRRKSSDSVDSLGNAKRPTFNEFGRGRHSNTWLFGGVSIRETVRGLWEPSSKN